MTPERSKLLGELLLEMSEDPRGFIPDEAWLAAQKAFALPYVEIAIVRRNHERMQILLAHRSDEYWVGWHLPGGLWRTRQTLQDCVASLAEIELGKDARVSLLAQGMWEKWHDHPYGNIISHVAICLVENAPEITTIKWFEDVPDDLIDDRGHHARFIRSALDQANGLI